MEKFAKVFESNNRQFLVLKNTNDDGDLKLSVISRFEGAGVDFGFIFDEEDADTQMKLDYAFDNFDQDAADVLGNRLKDAITAMDVLRALQS